MGKKCRKRGATGDKRIQGEGISKCESGRGRKRETEHKRVEGEGGIQNLRNVI